ncbi:MAG: hypothetical protein KIT58_03560 [Planctomycetota bacterium]|nr:hypothetical protein [Planctomycetota bacterium]
MSWSSVLELLERWHRDRDHGAARTVFAFLEQELRREVSARQPELEDALRDVLARLVEAPLPPGVHDPRAYLVTALHRRGIDLVRAKQRRREHGGEQELIQFKLDRPRELEPGEAASSSERAERVRGAIRRLEIADRVALKLCDAPEWLDDEEVLWLASRLSCTSEEVHAAVGRAGDMHDLTRIYDPGTDDPRDPEARRKRMERFRKRRNRIAERVAQLLAEDAR